MIIPEEIIYYLADNFLNFKEISNMLVVNKEIKKNIMKLYTAYIGNVIFLKLNGGDLNDISLDRKDILNMKEYLDYINIAFKNTKKLDSFKNFANIIINPCNSFNVKKKKKIKLFVNYKSSLEFGLLLRIKGLQIQDSKNILIYNNRYTMLRNIKRNIYLPSCIKNEKHRKKLLLKKFRSVYSIIID